MEDGSSRTSGVRSILRFRRGATHRRKSPQPRTILGVDISADVSSVSGALVSATGRGTDMHVEVVAKRHVAVPSSAANLYRQLADGKHATPSHLAVLGSQLAKVVDEVTGQLKQQSNTRCDPLAVAICDGGLWSLGEGSLRHALALVDASRVAELTGYNVIDGFALGDLANNGQGGPLTTVPLWMLLNDPQRTRVLLDLGRTTRMTYLPATDRDGAERVVAMDVGPGMALLDHFVKQLTAGDQQFDPGGRLAVQGRRVERLLQHWLGDPYFSRPLPRWHPHGVSTARFLADSVEMAVDADWNVRDLLCTATHFIADSIQLAINRLLETDRPIDQLLVTGGGSQNGMLLQEISERIEPISVHRLGEVGLDDETIPATSAAILGLLHIDGVAASQPTITGAHSPQVLGRLTRGTPDRWQQLVETISGASTGSLKSRKAG